jgi:radical SAM protein with 4Fe4S-binding SPASM domain
MGIGSVLTTRESNMPDVDPTKDGRAAKVAITPARNIDVISYRLCDQNCRQCSYVEAEIDPEAPSSSNAEVDFIRLLRSNYSESVFFLYPRDIVTATSLLPIMQEIGQSETLTNGRRLDVSLLEQMRTSGLKKIQITLFGTAVEQQIYNRNTMEEYKRIKANIRLCVERGFHVQVNNVLSRETMYSIEVLAVECVRLGVSQLRFIRLEPIGTAVKEFTPEIYLTQSDLVEVVIPTFEHLKLKYGHSLYLCFAVNFGPNFYKKSLRNAQEKLLRRLPRSDTFCLAIDGQYWVISTQSGNVHWCFNNLNDPKTRIGKVDWKTGCVTIDQPVDLSRKTLRKKLRGICSAESCNYQDVCLGGCRKAAISFAQSDAPNNRLYAGMDMCLTPAYAQYYARIGFLYSPRHDKSPSAAGKQDK